MKYLLLSSLNFIFFLLLISCKEPVSVNQSGCKLPFDTNSSNREFLNSDIILFHMHQKTSPDGEKLAYMFEDVVLEILNLRTGNIQLINIQNKLPSNVKFLGYSSYDWCPYNSDRIVISAATNTDTIGNGKHYVWGINLYIISLDGSEFTKITPKDCPKEGAEAITGLNWLKESYRGRDQIYGFFYFKYSGDPYKNIKDGPYIPQTN